ncbi:MAG TPA: lamin tail domain-containing protein, partial [Anaerolineae bacterium]|nr:lamin tail domain-containing protein [Anaerolineae bacterium]
MMMRQLSLLGLCLLIWWGVGSWLLAEEVEELVVGPVVINEWSQGHGGQKEWVELVVVADMDLRGWSLGDETAGDLVWADVPLWEMVPAGTVVVVYNGNEPDDSLPPVDEEIDDCRLVLPHTGDYFVGSWPNFANSNDEDNPQVVMVNGEVSHRFNEGPGVSVRAGGQERTGYQGGGVAEVGMAEMWGVAGAETGSPGEGNTEENESWLVGLGCEPPVVTDIGVSVTAPLSVTAGSEVIYELGVMNVSSVPAATVVVTAVLDGLVSYEGSSLPAEEDGGILVWEWPMLEAGEMVSWVVTGTVASTAQEGVVVMVEGGTETAELVMVNNFMVVMSESEGGEWPWVGITAVYYDTYETNQPDEAIEISNKGTEAVSLAGWRLEDGGGTAATWPAGAVLGPGESWWVAKEGAAFGRQFGFEPDFEVVDSLPTVAQLEGRWPGYRDDGDGVLLYRAEGSLADSVQYGDRDGIAGWAGVSIQPYQNGNLFGRDGQILYRRVDSWGEMVADSDEASDWAQMRLEPVLGRKVRYPGWQLDLLASETVVTATNWLTIGVAPDNAFALVMRQIERAEETLLVAALTMENMALGMGLVAAAERGVTVTV